MTIIPDTRTDRRAALRPIFLMDWSGKRRWQRGGGSQGRRGWVLKLRDGLTLWLMILPDDPEHPDWVHQGGTVPRPAVSAWHTVRRDWPWLAGLLVGNIIYGVMRSRGWL